MIDKQWRIASYPTGSLQPDDFTLVEAPLPDELHPGQVRVRTLYISLDPTNRVWFTDESYLPPLEIGEVMPGMAMGIVEESNNAAFVAGQLVQGLWGWRTFHVGDGGNLTVLPDLPGLPVTAHFGLLGHIGLSAYHGMLNIGRPRPGETVVVSSAAGAVGSLAGQIAKLQGARVVGIAGGSEKCRRVTQEYGFDDAVDYTHGDFTAALADVCGDGVDVYFDNVGGPVLDSVLFHINEFGRVVASGMISEYNSATGHQFRNLSRLVNKRVTVQGYIVLDHLDLVDQAYPELISWHLNGKLKYRIDVVDGIENVPTALGRLFNGSNTGKLIARVS
ncbi:NADP-dependent oxidoreductase [Mycolicibacterium mengxianglii]|uniref:NADP-dependent oxidoreductase n=1 Tax=Mycolicibacterium mengxianglii TaxID=2736649 RepID=UPI0018D1676C|nr:NADP-dependent oxidoreductase [Mycolicibacterium mengxianglii]